MSQQQPRILFHHLKFSRGARIFWVLEELGLPYDVVVHALDKNGDASTLRHVAPLAKAPALVLDGELLYESAAIITTLLARFPSGSVQGASSPQSTFWGYFSEGSTMLFFQSSRVLAGANTRMKRSGELAGPEAAGADKLAKWYADWSAGHLQLATDVVEKYLGDNEWFSGGDQPGLGDFMMLTAVMAALGKGPNTQAWIARVRARPAFRRAMARMKAEETGKQAKSKL